MCRAIPIKAVILAKKDALLRTAVIKITQNCARNISVARIPVKKNRDCQDTAFSAILSLKIELVQERSRHWPTVTHKLSPDRSFLWNIQKAGSATISQ